MRNIFMMALLVVTFSAHAHAKEMSYADVVSDPTNYVGKPIVMKGSFVYSEPMRESFTFDQNGNLIEVFYRDLPGNDKEFILSLQKYSKVSLMVSGTLQQYTNRARSYFINASSLRVENGASPVPSNVNLISYADILSAPGKYVNKPVMMKGSFAYSEPMRQSFTFDQNGNRIEVLLGDLSRTDRELILSQKKYSKTPVTVTGVLQPYANNTNTYFINAYSVGVEN
jgi:hypothetical protein